MNFRIRISEMRSVVRQRDDLNQDFRGGEGIDDKM